MGWAIQTSTCRRRFDAPAVSTAARPPSDWRGPRVKCTLDPDDPRSPSLLVRNVRSEYGIRGMRSSCGRRQAARPSRRARSVEDGSRRGDRDQRRPHGPATLGPGRPPARLIFPRCVSCSTTVSTPRQDRTWNPPSRKCCTFRATRTSCIRQADVRAYRERDGIFPAPTCTTPACASPRPSAPSAAFGAATIHNGLWTPNVSYAEHLKIFTEVAPLQRAGP